MKKTAHILFITLFGVSNCILGMENATQNSPFYADSIMWLASHCQPHEKNNLMKVCKFFHTYLSQNKKSLLLANPSTVSEHDKQKSLLDHVRAGNEEMVYRLLSEAKVNPNIHNLLGMTPLHYTKQEGIIKFLQEYGAITEEKPLVSRFHEAVYNGDSETVKRLLKAGSNPNTSLNFNNGRTPLHIAIYQNNSEIVQLLLDAKADINKKNNNGESPLRIAAQKGRADILELLIHHGAYHQTSNNDSSPLYKALKNGHAYCANLLVTWTTVDNKAYGDEKNTPLHIASEYGYTDVVQLLTANVYLNIDEQNNYGETPLFVATANSHADVVELLINKKAKADKENVDGCSPLHRALQRNLVDVVRLLIKGGADVNKENKDNKTPLCIATENDFLDIVKLLVEAKADTNKEPLMLYIDTPLCIAATTGNNNIAHLLLSGGANINMEHRRFIEGDMIPLHMASYNGHIDMVALLLSAGADITRTCEFNDIKRTASQLAEYNRHQEIEKLLRNHKICLRELIENGANQAFSLAADLGYDSRVLYNHILNIQAHKQKNFIGSMKAIFNISLQSYKNELSALNQSPLKEDAVYQEKLSLLHRLSLKNLSDALSPLNSNPKSLDQNQNNTSRLFEGWKQNLK